MQGRLGGALRAGSLPRQRWAALDLHYELLGELGRGGMADVYHARDRRTGAELAVKVVHARTLEDEDALARFAREARTTAQLAHPNIVSVITTRELEDGSLALVMPYVPGQTLREMLRRRGALPADRIERILRDVAAALGAAHDAGIVHRDVKPENIFIDQRDGRSLLSDFGIARAIDSETVVTRTGMSIGTPAYMSPEQIDGRYVDGQSDLFSLGLVGWEMATGVRPWAGESLYSVIYKQINEELAPVASLCPDMPWNLALAIDGALIKDRAIRWSSTAEIVAQLDRRDGALAGERGARIARYVGSRLAVAPPSAHETAVFARPRRSEAVEAAGLSDADLALVRPRRLGRWAAVPLVAGLALLVAMAMRNGRLSLPLALQDAGAPAGADGGLMGDAPLPDEPGSAAAAMIDSSSVPDTSATDSLGAIVSGQRADSVALPEGESAGAGEGAFSDSAMPVLTAPMPPAPPAGAALASPPPPPTPTPVLNVRSASARTVAAGGMHSCAISAAGELSCWGGNDRGQLGSGATTRQAEPARIAGDGRFRAVAAGVGHSCALAVSGEAYCWGANDKGQLGDGSTTARGAPVAVAGGRSYRVVRAGMSHTCALTMAGEVHCWGANTAGQLGNGTTAGAESPVRVLADERFAALAVGWNHACALTDGGRAFCWGQNAGGQLGDGTTTNRYAPTPVLGAPPFEQIAAGGTHSCATGPDGVAYCWGSNGSGQLGDGTTENRLQPARVASQLSFETITAGSVHSCALTRGGQAYCWGRNSYGQLGDGGTEARSAPTRVSGEHGFSNIDATGAHTCAQTGSGESFCWGYNVEGQLGDGTRAHRARPVYADKPSG